MTSLSYEQPASTDSLSALHLQYRLKLRQTEYTTGDSCDGRISVLNHSLSWSKFVNTHLYHSRQWIKHTLIAYVTLFRQSTSVTDRQTDSRTGRPPEQKFAAAS